jgi:hypothetical protein
MDTGTMRGTTSADPLLQAVEAVRLLGRWTMVGQRHGQGCSCCPPGLGDVPMDEVEKNIMASLKKDHPILEGRESLTLVLKDCVARKPLGTPEQVAALYKDVGSIVDELEKIQLGFY